MYLLRIIETQQMIDLEGIMGLFDKYKKKQRQAATTSSSTRTASPEMRFYNDCVEDFHKAALRKGFVNRGVIFIPELIPFGEKIVLAFLEDRSFQMQFGDNPQLYYYVIMSLSLQAGIVFAEKWHSDYSALKSGYANQIIEEGPADACKPFLAQLGLTDSEKENDFYYAIFERWLVMNEPYWKLSDPRNYTFNAMVAAYQLGISMILEKLGY